MESTFSVQQPYEQQIKPDFIRSKAAAIGNMVISSKRFQQSSDSVRMSMGIGPAGKAGVNANAYGNGDYIQTPIPFSQHSTTSLRGKVQSIETRPELQVPSKQSQRLQIPSLPVGDQTRAAQIASRTNQSMLSGKGQMYDFRISNKRLEADKPEASSLTRRQLEPIAENQNAHITHLFEPKRPPARNFVNSSASTLTELSQVDNGIMFLDNYQKIVNPKGMPTPPPPMWGTLLEEDNYDPKAEFYNHDKAIAEMAKRDKSVQQINSIQNDKPSSKRLKLKKKVVYTYEYASDKSSEEQKTTEIPKIKDTPAGSTRRVKATNLESQILKQRVSDKPLMLLPPKASESPGPKVPRSIQAAQSVQPFAAVRSDIQMKRQSSVSAIKPIVTIDVNQQKNKNFVLIKSKPEWSVKEKRVTNERIRTGGFQRIGSMAIRK